MSEVIQPEVAEAPAIKPILVQPEKKKKKKYSKGLRGPQELLVASSKGHEKVVAAVHVALEDWIERNDKSSTKRKDGILKDGLMNISRAAHKGLRKALKGPEKFMNELEKTKLYKKRFKPFRLI